MEKWFFNFNQIILNLDVFLKQENNIDASNLRSPFNTFFSTNEKFFPFESKSFNLDHYSCTRPSENKENLSSVSQISRKRGPYKHYSPSKKRQALDIYYSSFLSSNDDRNAKNSTQKISKSLDIPCNTLKRWIKVGIYRRKGAGRKLLDPLMEEHLYKWCQSELNKNNLLTGREIRKMARNLSSNKETFKASKGWLVGFLKRFKLEQCMY